MSRHYGTLAAAVFVFAARADAQCTRAFVDDSATGNNDGTEWQHAYTSLQSALMAVPVCGEIWVAAGTYKPDQGPGVTPGDRDATFQLVNGKKVYGGFHGDENPATFDLDDRDFVADETTLSGDIGTANVHTDNVYHVVDASGTGTTTILDGPESLLDSGL